MTAVQKLKIQKFIDDHSPKMCEKSSIFGANFQKARTILTKFKIKSRIYNALQKKKKYKDNILLPLTNKDMKIVFWSNQGIENKSTKPRQDLVLLLQCIATQRISDRRGDVIYIMSHRQKLSKHHPNIFDVSISKTLHNDNSNNNKS